VGPALSRTRAEQVQKQIENTVGVKGIVIPHP
jgi:cell division septation protein DedD